MKPSPGAGGWHQSMITLVAQYPSRCHPKPHQAVWGGGLRVGYAIAQPDRLKVGRPAGPLAGEWNRCGAHGTVAGTSGRYKHWCSRVQRWTASQGVWMQRELARVPGITPMPSAANFLLISGRRSLVLLEARRRSSDSAPVVVLCVG